jgi:hypothetical protein
MAVPEPPLTVAGHGAAQLAPAGRVLAVIETETVPLKPPEPVIVTM